MGWDGGRYTTPRETDDGIKARSTRGEFVKNWWATRWIEAMEALMDRGRLQRGRNYARMGQVIALNEEKGRVTAAIQGARPMPYKASIRLSPLSEGEWNQVLEAMAERPVFVAQLLDGQMPQDIEDAFRAARLNLFPGPAELEQSCNCPDYAGVCKHLAAAHYVLAQRFDEDPFLLFRLRGKTREEIIAALGGAGKPAEGAAVEEGAYAQPLAAPTAAAFWEAGPELAQVNVHIAPPEEPYPLLERLGPPPFLPDAQTWFAKAYDRASAKALEIAFPPAPKEARSE